MYLKCWVFSREVSSTIFKVFGMTRPGIEPRSSGPLANTLPTRPMNWDRLFGQVGRVFANDPGVMGSVSGRVIPKTLKMVLDTFLLNTQRYKVRLRIKWSNPGKGVAPYPTPRCSSYWKRSPRVALNNGRQIYFTPRCRGGRYFFPWIAPLYPRYVPYIAEC